MKAARLQAEVNDATTTVVLNAKREIERDRDGLAAQLSDALRNRLRERPTATTTAAPCVSVGAARLDGGATRPIAPQSDPRPSGTSWIESVAAECVAAASDADNYATVIRGWQQWYREQKRAWELQ